jgi:hypothetical protein
MSVGCSRGKALSPINWTEPSCGMTLPLNGLLLLEIDKTPPPSTILPPP